MTLRTSVVVKSGVSAVSLTGGSDTTFVNTGTGTNGANVLVDSGNGNLVTRRSLITRLVEPVPAVNANALAKLGRASLTMHHPKLDASLKKYKRASEFSLAYHPDDSEEERETLLLNSIAIVSSPEFRDFFVKGIHA